MFKFIGPVLRLLGTGANKAADASDEKPKTAISIAGVLAVFGIAPETTTHIGDILVKFGTWLQALS